MMLRMKAADYVNLEKNRAFKRKYLTGTFLWKNILVVPPVLFLFLGLFGLLYLLSYQLLLSYYAIPFFVVFVIGTIWLKAAKRHIQNQKLSDENSFKVCIGYEVCTNGGYTCFVFTNEDKRHNEYLTKQLAESLSSDNILSLMKECRKKTITQHDKSSNANYFLISYSTRSIGMKNALWKTNEALPLLFIDSNNVQIIKGVDLNIK